MPIMHATGSHELWTTVAENASARFRQEQFVELPDGIVWIFHRMPNRSLVRVNLMVIPTRLALSISVRTLQTTPPCHQRNGPRRTLRPRYAATSMSCPTLHVRPESDNTTDHSGTRRS